MEEVTAVLRILLKFEALLRMLRYPDSEPENIQRAKRDAFMKKRGIGSTKYAECGSLNTLILVLMNICRGIVMRMG